MSPRRNNDEPVSKLFLSCDLTGSTAFKQRADHDPQAPWQKVFLQFYREFPQTLRLQQADQAHTGAKDLLFELWKPVGDELIFTCDVQRESDVWEAIRLWVATMREYRHKSLTDENLRIGGGPKLGVKGGAFIGTFPGPDSESSIPRHPSSERSGRDVVTLNKEALRGARGKRKHSEYLFDYFGPSIDTGFRVLGRCSSRFFTVSVEVAYVLSTLHAQNTIKPYKCDDLVLLTGAELKGVWGGRTYPMFALDLEADDEVNKAFAKFEPPKAHAPDILELCKACYSSDGWPFRVYLPGSSPEGPFHVVPDDPLSGYVEEDAAATRLEDPAEPNPVDADEDLLS